MLDSPEERAVELTCKVACGDVWKVFAFPIVAELLGLSAGDQISEEIASKVLGYNRVLVDVEEALDRIMAQQRLDRLRRHPIEDDPPSEPTPDLPA